MTSWKANVFLHLSSANEANLKGIGKKWFVFIFPEVNYFYSCGTLPFISFILTAFHSSGTRASVCVTWVLINQPWCSIHHSKEWQQPVELLCKTPCAESKLKLHGLCEVICTSTIPGVRLYDLRGSPPTQDILFTLLTVRNGCPFKSHP